MPIGGPTDRCVKKLISKGKPKKNAIAICVASTKRDYRTGKKVKG